MPSFDAVSVTRWIEGLRQGDEVAIQEIWNRCHERLIRFVRKKLEGSAKRIADEDDVLLSAFKSFCAAAKKGRFPTLKDSDGFWRLILSITARKAIDLRRYINRDKRRALGETALMPQSSGTGLGGITAVPDDSPAPDFELLAAEEIDRLLAKLGEADLQAVAVAKLEGLMNKEIAKRHDVAVRTVERQLQLIRKKWQAELKS